LELFFRTAIICFVSLAGLYVVIDCFNNFQEFNTYGKQMEWGILQVLCQYYVARLFWFFDLMAGVMAMLAGLFAVTWMQRANEMTALSAAAIPPSRIDTHSLLHPGAFLCLAGADGQAWVDAANEIAARHGVPIVALLVGRELQDVDGAWTRLRGHGEQGVVLVRPDGFVAARMPTHADDPAAWLDGALRVALGTTECRTGQSTKRS